MASIHHLLRPLHTIVHPALLIMHPLHYLKCQCNQAYYISQIGCVCTLHNVVHHTSHITHLDHMQTPCQLQIYLKSNQKVLHSTPSQPTQARKLSHTHDKNCHMTKTVTLSTSSTLVLQEGGAGPFLARPSCYS